MHFPKIVLLLCILAGCYIPKKFPQPLDSETLKVKPLTEGVFVHVSYLETEQFGHVACNGMVYVRGNEAMVFDTPADSTTSEQLIHLIETTWKKRIKAVIVNHFHTDCLGGLGAFHRRHIPSYANRLTIELARAKGDVVVPQIGFDNVLRLPCGDRTVENRYFGEAHTRDNIVSYLPEEKTLFGGCMVKAMNAGKGYLGDATVGAWSATIDQVKKTYPDLKFVIPGHGESGGVELLDFTAKLFREEK